MMKLPGPAFSCKTYFYYLKYKVWLGCLLKFANNDIIQNYKLTMEI